MLFVLVYLPQGVYVLRRKEVKALVYEVIAKTADSTLNPQYGVGYYCKSADGEYGIYTKEQLKVLLRNKHIVLGYKLDSLGRLIVDRQKLMPLKGITAQPLSNEQQNGYRVYTGDSLHRLIKQYTAGKRPRYAVGTILGCLAEWKAGRVCVVKGLRRTGKTVAILQVIEALFAQGINPNVVGYIAVIKEINASEVTDFIRNTALQYVFIDEMTLLTGLLSNLKLLADAESAFKKIVLAGSDSYVWPKAAMDVLYGRMLPVDMTYMSLKEYIDVVPERVSGLSKRDIVDYFCKVGGILDEREYVGRENTLNSLQTAVAENIINTILRNRHHPTIRERTGELYKVTRDELLEAVIYALLSVCRTQNSELFKTDGVKIPQLVTDILRIQGTCITSGIDTELVRQLSIAMIELNVLDRVDNYARSSSRVLPQGHTKYVCNISSLYNTIVGTIETRLPLTGAAYKNLVLSQCVQFVKKAVIDSISAFSLDDIRIGYCRYDIPDKCVGLNGETIKTPEIDLVIRRSNWSNASTCVVEIKTDDNPRSLHTENMFLPSMNKALGNIDKYVVVYTGDTQTIRKVTYVNVYDFLMNIGGYIF
jgi:predicted AAA+ superfamily ATPase